jgi:putative methionine-R-sulfoxide reductase with GAF domain
VVGTAHAITARAVAVSNDVERDPRYLTNQQDSGSELIVAILAIGRVVGTLDIEDDEVGAFDGAAIARYESVAGRAARALG